MIFKATRGQTSYGESIGVLLLDTYCPFIQGDVANATSYDYPVRFKRVEGLTVEKIFNHDPEFIESMVECAIELEKEGVKAITGDCGFMAIYQDAVKEKVNIPVFLSSLLQIPFIKSTLPSNSKIGIITANSESLTEDVFTKIGIAKDDSIVMGGLENASYFRATVFDETGSLDKDMLEKEVNAAVDALVYKEPGIGSILLECSMLPVYSHAVQKRTGLPVYDFLSMINYVHSSLVKKRFHDVM